MIAVTVNLALQARPNPDWGHFHAHQKDPMLLHMMEPQEPNGDRASRAFLAPESEAAAGRLDYQFSYLIEFVWACEGAADREDHITGVEDTTRFGRQS